jgi:hypothetical protein
MTSDFQKNEIPDFGIQFVAFSGPRQLTDEQRIFVGEVVHSFIDNVLPGGAIGRKILTGCSIGTDAAVIEEARKRKAAFRVYTIMDEFSGGGWKDTNRAGLDLAAFEGKEIVWKAGGPLTETLGTRLKGRIHRMLDDIGERGFGSGLIAFWAQTPGTEMAVKAAIQRELPVVLYPLSDSFAPPKIRGGHWVRRNASGIKGRGLVFRKS